MTQRGLALSFAVITEYDDYGRAVAGVNWARLAAAMGTVGLMGAGSRPVTHGRSPVIPVTLIR